MKNLSPHTVWPRLLHQQGDPEFSAGHLTCFKTQSTLVFDSSSRSQEAPRLPLWPWMWRSLQSLHWTRKESVRRSLASSEHWAQREQLDCSALLKLLDDWSLVTRPGWGQNHHSAPGRPNWANNVRLFLGYWVWGGLLGSNKYVLLWGAFYDTGKALTYFLILDFVGKGNHTFYCC